MVAVSHYIYGIWYFVALNGYDILLYLTVDGCCIPLPLIDVVFIVFDCWCISLHLMDVVFCCIWWWFLNFTLFDWCVISLYLNVVLFFLFSSCGILLFLYVSGIFLFYVWYGCIILLLIIIHNTIFEVNLSRILILAVKIKTN